MAVIQTGLFDLYERFPDRKETIKKRFAQSENFKDLCSDYQECLAALEYWKRSEANYAFRRRQEYKVLLQELEEEVLEYLDQSRL